MAQKPKAPKAKTPTKGKAAPQETAAAEPKKRGAQVRRSREIEQEILARIAAGQLVRRICADTHMPDAVTWYRWLAQDEDLQARYAIAKDAQVEAELDEIRDLADRPLDVDENGVLIEGMDKERRREELQVRRMRIHTRQWRVPKLAPRKYGQKSELFLADHRTTPVSEMPDDVLDGEITDLMAALTGQAKGQTKH